jgi:hypothetical protein
MFVCRYIWYIYLPLDFPLIFQTFKPASLVNLSNNPAYPSHTALRVFKTSSGPQCLILPPKNASVS